MQQAPLNCNEITVRELRRVATEKSSIVAVHPVEAMARDVRDEIALRPRLCREKGIAILQPDVDDFRWFWCSGRERDDEQDRSRTVR